MTRYLISLMMRSDIQLHFVRKKRISENLARYFSDIPFMDDCLQIF